MARSPFKFFMSMGALCCPWAMATRVPIQSAQKPYASFPLLYVLFMKFDHNSRYITSLKMRTDNDNRPSIYSLTYLASAFDSGELKQCYKKLGLRIK